MGMQKNSYKAVMWQQNTESLSYDICSDNNLVQTLSNLHTPKEVEEGGIKGKRKFDDVHKRYSATVL